MKQKQGGMQEYESIGSDTPVGGGGQTHSNEPVFRLKLEGLLVIVNQSKASAFATTELCSEAKDNDLLLGSLVHGRQLVTKLILR